MLSSGGVVSVTGDNRSTQRRIPINHINTALLLAWCLRGPGNRHVEARSWTIALFFPLLRAPRQQLNCAKQRRASFAPSCVVPPGVAFRQTPVSLGHLAGRGSSPERHRSTREGRRHRALCRVPPRHLRAPPPHTAAGAAEGSAGGQHECRYEETGGGRQRAKRQATASARYQHTWRQDTSLVVPHRLSAAASAPLTPRHPTEDVGLGRASPKHPP